jgi:hypothetical protein
MKMLPRISALIMATAISAGVLAISTLSAQAAGKPVWSDLGIHNTFTRSFQAFNGPEGDGCCGTGYLAGQFSPTASGTLDHLDLGLGNYLPYGGLPGVVVALVPDAGGLPNENGTAIEEWVVTKLPGYTNGGPTIKVTKLVSKTHPAVTAGAKYWLVLMPLGYDTVTLWFYNSVNANALQAVSGNGASNANGNTPWSASTYLAPAFDVWVQ